MGLAGQKVVKVVGSPKGDLLVRTSASGSFRKQKAKRLTFLLLLFRDSQRPENVAEETWVCGGQVRQGTRSFLRGSALREQLAHSRGLLQREQVKSYPSNLLYSVYLTPVHGVG